MNAQNNVLVSRSIFIQFVKDYVKNLYIHLKFLMRKINENFIHLYKICAINIMKHVEINILERIQIV